MLCLFSQFGGEWPKVTKYLLTHIHSSFANRSRRFIDAYHKGLTKEQLIWVNKRYHGHRLVPEKMMEEFDLEHSYQP
jgi:hypothetical protein